jgi:hypothetical protein
MPTLATYQGLPCRDVVFRRTRGWKADVSSVVFFAADFPEGFEFVTPQPGELRSHSRFDLRLLPDVGTPIPPPLPRRLEFAGPLVLVERDRLGNHYTTVVDPLYCVSVETVRRNHDGSVAVVVARLVDARYFNAQGFCRRWSFNRTDPEGQYARDSVTPSGAPFTLGQIAGEVAGQLFTTPPLAKVPDGWKTATPAVELPPFGPAAGALTKLARDHGAGELCLTLDGSVALHSPGEGRVGHAPGGKGAENSADFPARLFLDLRGTGQARGVELTYPPDFVVVVGGLRVATVRLDDLEPVLVIEDVVVPLTEKTVRKLTNGRFGLVWLHRFVLAPQAYQNQVGLDPRVLSLLREQAYRLWRVPGVDIDEPFQEAFGVSGWTPPTGKHPTFEQVVDGLRQSTSGQKSRVKGPNAHLLPLLDRAETSAGRRLPVRVDTFRFASVHRAMGDTQEAAAAYGAQAELAALREEIRFVAHSKKVPDPFSATDWSLRFDERYFAVPELARLIHDAGLRHHHVTHEQLNRAINQHRLIDRIGQVSTDLARNYARSLQQLYDLEHQAGGPGKTLFEIAKQVVEFEKQISKSRGNFDTPFERSQEAIEDARRLRDELKGKLRELDRQLEEQRLRTGVGATPKATPRTAVFVKNLPRQLDADARVFSAELGVIQTSDLSGHVAEEGVPVAEATWFVPKPPLVTFGAVLRPKVADAPKKRPVTGTSASSHASETKVPEILSDRESYYTAAFKRTHHGRAEPVGVDAVPAGEGVPIERPDLVELVPLEGDSNHGALDLTARALAEAAFHRPDRVESAKYSIARPWPVNCDGVVAGVEIAMRPNGKGFVTTIFTGSDAPAFKPFDQTRERPRRRARPSDAAARNGTLP